MSRERHDAMPFGSGASAGAHDHRPHVPTATATRTISWMRPGCTPGLPKPCAQPGSARAYASSRLGNRPVPRRASSLPRNTESTTSQPDRGY
jgi:hypothetical protein